MIVCPVCSKENQDHYKFCLGCGSDLPRASGDEAKPLSTATPPAGIAAVSAQAVAAPAAPAAAAATADTAAPAPESAPVTAAASPAPPEAQAEAAPAPPADSPAPSQGVACANCGAAIPPGFAFCGACGTPIGGAAPPAAAPEAAAKVTGASAGAGKLILIKPDGTEGGMVEIPTSPVAVGRDAGGFFGEDAYLSPRHAVFRTQDGKIVVKDEASLNGVFYKILPNQPIEITSGTIFRIGQELILFEAIDQGATGPDDTARMGSPITGLWGRISLIIGKGRLGNSFPIGIDNVVLGRERGNILFPEDGYISGVHLRIHMEGGKVFLTDLGSSNGSYIKVADEKELADGDFILMGTQLFRIQV